MIDSASINVFYDFLEAPERSAAAVREDPPLGLGLAGYLLSALALFLAESLTGRAGLLGASLPGFLTVALGMLGLGLVQTAVVHLVAEGVGGQGRVSSLFVLMGLSVLGWALVLPGALVSLAFFPGSSWVLRLVFGAAWCVVFWLKLRSVALNYRFGMGPAFFALLFPFLAAAGAALLFLIVFLWSSVQSLASLVS